MSSDKAPRLPELPEGCTVFAHAGHLARREQADLVPAGSVMLPRKFFVHVTTPDGVTVILQFAVSDDGDVHLPEVHAPRGNVPQALDALREIRPLDFWRRYAITKLVARVLAEQLRTEHPDGEDVPGVESVLLGSDEDGVPPARVYLPGVAEIERSARSVPVLGRRNRITDQHLTDVATVYRNADAAGRPPTRAVAEHFQTSHSTAARWVGLARQAGKLPPAETGRKER